MTQEEEEADRLMSRGVDHLSNAQHRFDSIVRPLCRLCICLYPFIATAQKIAKLRHGNEEGADAESFLEFISGDEGMVRLVMLGCMADFGKICLRVIRFFDRETFDIAEVGHVLTDFRRPARPRPLQY